MKDTGLPSKMLIILPRSWKSISSYSMWCGSWGNFMFYKITRYLEGLIWSRALGHWSQHGILCPSEITVIPVNKNQAPFGFKTCSCDVTKVDFDHFPVYMLYLFFCLFISHYGLCDRKIWPKGGENNWRFYGVLWQDEQAMKEILKTM